MNFSHFGSSCEIQNYCNPNLLHLLGLIKFKYFCRKT